MCSVAGRVSRPWKKWLVRRKVADHATEAPSASQTPFICAAVKSTFSASATPPNAVTRPASRIQPKRSFPASQLTEVVIAGQR
jgi:hypothetical protein